MQISRPFGETVVESESHIIDIPSSPQEGISDAATLVASAALGDSLLLAAAVGGTAFLVCLQFADPECPQDIQQGYPLGSFPAPLLSEFLIVATADLDVRPWPPM